jgi:hypothetical protein
VFEPGSLSRRITIYSVAGAFIGTAWGAWSLAARGADRTAVPTHAQAPAAPSCPDGYVRAPAFDSTAIVEGTHNTRWLIRCDPIRSQAAISESLELFWAPEIIADPRARPEALRSFVRTIAQSNRVALEPLPMPETRTAIPATATTPAVDALVMDTRGGIRLPSFVARAWAVPAAGRTLLALLIARSDRAPQVEARAADAVSRVTGVRAYDPSAPSDRGFSVHASCPAGWTDATPHDGGPSPSFYVGRYCIEPSQGGGSELTFAEVTGRMEGEGGANRLFELAATMISAVGTRVTAGAADTDSGASTITQGFSRAETITIAGVEGRTARAEIEPPAARLALRAWMLPAGGGSIFALSTSLVERAEPVRAELDRWLASASVVRAYDTHTIQARRSQTFRANIIVPGAITALLGAVLAVLRQRS